ncbi:MAG TPA: hypothetical protein VEB21_05950 [Terriglobales bacterium]|nr:hypothetical protein [Terriglobales bacterium]
MNPNDCGIPRLRLAYEELVLEVRARPDHLAWLAEFLLPHFTESEGEPGWAIELQEDEDAYAAALRCGAGDGSTIDCFALDSAVVRLPRWHDAGRATAVFDRDYRCFYTVLPQRRQVRIVTVADNASIRTPLMRVVRELAMNHCHSRGGLFLHASAVAVGERGLVVTGRKAAGKTTLLMYLLGAAQAEYLANDRVLVSLAAAEVACRGLPSVVTIRPRTLELFPEIAGRLAGSGFRQQRTIAEAEREQLPPQPWSDGRYGLTPAQLCALVEAQPAKAAQLRAVVFPAVTERPGGVALRRLEREEAAARLVPSLLGAGSWKKTSDLFGEPSLNAGGDQGRSAEQRLIAMCRELARRVACFECQLGLQAYDNDRGRQALLALVRER